MNKSDFGYECKVCEAKLRIILNERKVNCCPICGYRGLRIIKNYSPEHIINDAIKDQSDSNSANKKTTVEGDAKPDNLSFPIEEQKAECILKDTSEVEDEN